MPSILNSPWKSDFEAFVAQAKKSLLICSPFVGRGPCERIVHILHRRGLSSIPLLFLTNLSIDNMLGGGTDISALVELCTAMPRAEIRFLPNLHAKVYVVDDRYAIVTSANLTESGLRKNYEYGIYCNELSLVRQIAEDINQYALLGSSVPIVQLRQFALIISELQQLKLQVEKQDRTTLREEFENKMKSAEETVLQARAEDMTQHSAFADTILYLLKQGPKDTRTLYTEVKRIHPDLCDDSVKLVIRGEEWSQTKWHHRIRHAQLYLKRLGKISRQDKKWCLVK